MSFASYTVARTRVSFRHPINLDRYNLINSFEARGYFLFSFRIEEISINLIFFRHAKLKSFIFRLSRDTMETVRSYLYIYNNEFLRIILTRVPENTTSLLPSLQRTCAPSPQTLTKYCRKKKIRFGVKKWKKYRTIR